MFPNARLNILNRQKESEHSKHVNVNTHAIVQKAKLTRFNNGRLVTGADRQNFEDAARRPQQLLVGVSPHDVDQCLRAPTGQDDQLHTRDATHVRGFDVDQVAG